MLCPDSRPSEKGKPDISPDLQFIAFHLHLAGIGLSVFRVIDLTVFPIKLVLVLKPAEYFEPEQSAYLKLLIRVLDRPCPRLVRS